MSATDHLLRTATAWLALVAGAGTLACSPAPSEEVPATQIERAREALRPFKEQLLAALMGSLENGPSSSVHVCREMAPRIAAELSVDGIEMGRTSHRLRNPANAPAPWIESLLADYVENPNLEPRAVYLDPSRIGYVEPIRVIHLCVSCHGPSVEPALLEQVRALYPEDQATGFRTGDLRGLFWVTMPVEG